MSAGTLIRFFASILLALMPLAARAGEPAPRGDAPCSGRIAEKLGVRFVEVCGGNEQDSFWISVAPMPCSAGEHATPDFLLACHAPGGTPARAPADEGAELAGFRCVVPTWSLATFE